MAPHPRTSAGLDEPVTAQAPAFEPAVVGPGDQFTINATVLRFVGPWVQLQVLGENVQVLRSTLNKEILHGR